MGPPVTRATRATRATLLLALSRCDAEISRCARESLTDDHPGGSLLGLKDWSIERRLIMQELETLTETETVNARESLNSLCARVHLANSRWWVDLETGLPIKRNVGELLMLCVSELAEALEGDRKNLMDDKLPRRKMFEVELADLIIRVFDIAGGLGLDLGGAFEEKMAYNRMRQDHTRAGRLAADGKKY